MEQTTKILAPNAIWDAMKENYLVSAETSLEMLTNENAGSYYITNIKSFFTDRLSKMMFSIGELFKTYNMTDQYYIDNVKNLKKIDLNKISKYNFRDIENISLKCVTGMNLNYLATTKELKQFLPMIKNLTTDLDNISTYVEKLINDTTDAKLSSAHFMNIDYLFETSKKSVNIIEELIDGRSVVDTKNVSVLFPNITSFKIVKDELTEINDELAKADIQKITKSVKRLIGAVTLWLKESQYNKNETYSTVVINDLQLATESAAKIITSFGMFLTLANYFTSYYVTSVDVLNNK